MLSFVKSKKGFTLMELLIVVLTLSIMVAVAIPIYQKIGEKTTKTTCLTQQRALRSNLITYFAGTASAAGTSGTGTFTTRPDGKTITFSGDERIYNALDSDEIPCCPVAGNIITVTYSVTKRVEKTSTTATEAKTTKATTHASAKSAAGSKTKKAAPPKKVTITKVITTTHAGTTAIVVSDETSAESESTTAKAKAKPAKHSRNTVKLTITCSEHGSIDNAA